MTVWTWLADLMGANVYAAHSLCLSNDRLIIFLYIAANETIFASYTAIGGVLSWTFVVDRAILINLTGRSGMLFAAFIFLCGLTHFSMDVLLFEGVYRLDVLVRVVTAIVSAITAVHVVVEKWDAHALAVTRKRAAADAGRETEKRGQP